MRDSLRTQINQVQLLALSDVQPGISGMIDNFRDKYTDKLNEEFLNGVSTAQNFITFVAQKPLKI